MAWAASLSGGRASGVERVTWQGTARPWPVIQTAPSAPSLSQSRTRTSTLGSPRTSCTTPPATLTRAREIGIRNGLHYVYTGNVHDSKGSSTYCPKCATRVIERDWYVLGDWRLADRGNCLACGTQIAGVFDGTPGQWGAKRVPVRIREEVASG